MEEKIQPSIENNSFKLIEKHIFSSRAFAVSCNANLRGKKQMPTYRELFQGGLQLFVISGGCPVHNLLLPASSSLAANTDLSLKLF